MNDEIILTFSQRMAIQLTRERAQDVAKLAQEANSQYLNILNKIAIEAGIKKEELANWQLNEDETKFRKLESAEEEKKDK